MALRPSVVALVWWSGSLWRRMVRSEAGAARLAVVSLVGLALAGALSLASASVAAALALRIDDVGDELLVFHTLAAVLLAASGFGVSTHLLATSILGARTRTFPSWVIGVGVLSAAGFLGRRFSAPRCSVPRRMRSGSWGSCCGVCGSWLSASACGATSALVRRPPDHDRIEAAGL